MQPSNNFFYHHTMMAWHLFLNAQFRKTTESINSIIITATRIKLDTCSPGLRGEMISEKGKLLPVTRSCSNVTLKMINHFCRFDKRNCNEINTLCNPKINVQPILQKGQCMQTNQVKSKTNPRFLPSLPGRRLEDPTQPQFSGSLDTNQAHRTQKSFLYKTTIENKIYFLQY